MANTDLKTKLTIEADAQGSEEIIRLRQQVDKLGAAADEASPEFAQLAEELGRLGQSQAAIAQFERLKTSTEQTAKQLQQLQQLQQATRDAALALKEQERAVAQATAANQKTGEQLKQQRAYQDELRTSIKSLAAEYKAQAQAAKASGDASAQTRERMADTSAAPLADGLQVQFIAGAAPSFVPSDAYSFAVHQPWAVGHVRDAHERAWGWAGGAATLTIDLGAPTPIEAIALARYHLPNGAQVRITIDGGAPHTLETSGPVAVWMLPAPVQAARLTITVAQAEGGHIGWVWAGAPLSTDHHASQCQRTRRWAVGRAGGINPAGLYAGAGDGWRLAWSPSDWSASRLVQADMDRLMALLDWAQQRDEPLILVPHHRHPQDAALVRPGADALEITDQHAWQADDVQQRLLSATLELEPVYA